MRRPAATLVRAALPLWLLVATPASSDEPLFVTLAEGFTSADEETGIVAGQRMFTAPTFLDVCAPLEAPDRLVLVGNEPVELTDGEWFPYDRLIVVAVDVAGAVLPPVPIAIDVEQVEPPVLSLRSDMTANDEVLAIAEGRFRLRVQTRCDDHAAELMVEAEVVGP